MSLDHDWTEAVINRWKAAVARTNSTLTDSLIADSGDPVFREPHDISIKFSNVNYFENWKESSEKTKSKKLLITAMTLYRVFVKGNTYFK